MSFSEKSRGKQCLSSAMYAIAKSRLKSVSSWTTVDMDEVLQFGDKLYLDIAATVHASNYLQAKELPKRLSSCNTEFNVLQSDPMSGLLYSSSCQPPFVTIDAALQKALCSDDHHGCLVIVSVYAFAVMRSSLKSTISMTHTAGMPVVWHARMERQCC